MKKNQDEEINKEIVKSVISRGIPVEKFFELGGEIIKLDSSHNSTHVNVFEMAGIDPKKVDEKSNNLDYNILNKEVGTMEQTHPPRRTYYLNSRSILSRGQDDYFLFV